MNDTQRTNTASNDSDENAKEEITGVVQLLDRIEATADERSRSSLGNVVDALGHGSFVPLLLVAGLVMLAPVIGDIPGVPVLMGLLVILVAGQILFHRQQLWLPGWLRNRAVSSSKIQKTVGWMRRPAQFMDRWTKRRYEVFVRHASASVIAVVCIVIAAATPLMEVVPMSANVAGVAITAFALALLVHDGLIAIGAIVLSLATLGLVIYQFM